ncbi:hypothetical protein [Pseudaeromonas sharmana]|uniref:hypothetical protein n=1 Tax=Pseudaeromonas sharmana TaxID=328412 RepID=UPI0036710A68
MGLLARKQHRCAAGNGGYRCARFPTLLALTSATGVVRLEQGAKAGGINMEVLNFRLLILLDFTSLFFIIFFDWSSRRGQR